MPNQDDKFARLSRRSAEGQTIQATVDVVIRPDQQGSQSAAAILESAQDGQAIRISAGTYRFDKPVKISRSVTLVGDSKGTTRFISTVPGECFSIEGQVRCSVKGISFEHEGDTVGTVFHVKAEMAEFRNCSFSGARRISEEDENGGGLVISGRTEVSCDECEATRNENIGFVFSDDARAVVSSCTADGNGSDGFLVNGRCAATLRNNRATRNENGIGYFGNSSGDASSNECTDNTNAGLNIGENASPSLTSNVLKRNKAGLLYGQQTAGLAVRNICSENLVGGIQVKDQAHPVLNENRCEKNANHGIAIGDNAYGSVRSNVCNNNETFGIVVMDEAHPIVEGNTCSNNGEIGIGYKGRATGICRGNKCDGHLANIHVVENANPQLEDEGGSPISASAASGNTNSQSGDCFVVTATYGTPFAPEVQRFRRYRDSVLLKNVAGRLFIRTYYVIGPKLAGIIRRVPLLRRASAKMLGRLAVYLPD
jgi:parallel beta-helix repeat protein